MRRRTCRPEGDGSTPEIRWLAIPFSAFFSRGLEGGGFGGGRRGGGENSADYRKDCLFPMPTWFVHGFNYLFIFFVWGRRPLESAPCLFFPHGRTVVWVIVGNHRKPMKVVWLEYLPLMFVGRESDRSLPHHPVYSRARDAEGMASYSSRSILSRGKRPPKKGSACRNHGQTMPSI